MRLWAMWPAAIALAGLLAFGWRLEARSGTRVSVRRPVQEVTEPRWRTLRGLLDRAGRARRAGQVNDALVLYRQVADATGARADDREVAAMWWARLRLERGEWSAAIELERWIATRPDPAWLARVVMMLRRLQRRAARVEGDGARREQLRQLEVFALDVMASMACVEDLDGARARRWKVRLTDGA